MQEAAVPDASGASLGLAGLRQGLRDWESTGSTTYRTYYDVLLADALAKRGERAESLQVIDQSLRLVEQTDERMVEAELLRMRGELAIVETTAEASAWTAAASDFERALGIARRQEARSLELRAAISLVRWHLRQGQPAVEAKRVLAATCDAFTEGYQSADHVEARALLADST
jgi:predicted ATPase